MRKLLILLFILICNILYADCVCYHANHECCKKTCEYYADLVYEDCQIKPLSDFDNNTVYDKIFFVGFGNYYGLYRYDIIKFILNTDVVILWQSIAKIKANLLVIDACYAGYIFDYKSNIPVIVTSTGKENSWNIIDKQGNNIGSLSVALNCKYNRKYQCPINCQNLSINQCQLNLIIWSWKYKFILNGFKLYDWEYPSLGTCLVNNIKCEE